MQQAHEPADAKQSQQEATETIEPVTQPLTVGPFCNQTKHYAREKSKKERKLKMIETYVHS